MPIKKSELYSRLWQSCDELRGVKELAERYKTPLPDLNQRVAELKAKVNRHLKKMGFAP